MSSPIPTGASPANESPARIAPRRSRLWNSGPWILAALTWTAVPQVRAESKEESEKAAKAEKVAKAAEVDSALLEKARKHITDNIPKGLSPLKEPAVSLRSGDGVRTVMFSVELECDEERYTVKDLQAGSRKLSADAAQKIQAEGIRPQYLAKKSGRGQTIRISDSFKIRADGSCGAIKEFLPEKVGYLRGEQPDLVVEGDEKFLAAKAIADAAAKAQSDSSAAGFNALFGAIGAGLKGFGGVPAGQVDAATNIAGVATGASVPTAATDPNAAKSKPATPTPTPAPVPVPVPPPTPVVVTPPVPVVTTAPAPAAEDKWLTPLEAAALLKISESDVLNAIQKGDIKAKKIGPVYRINAKELQ